MRGPLLGVVKPVIIHVLNTCIYADNANVWLYAVGPGIFRQNYLDNLGERVHFCFSFHFYLVSKEVSNEF